ncbi:hypothetical protein [Roseiconus lacunae]|uniref:hypothetical protein n=1 Tax=Roseiconus lacunae TaxID=2605694 RepID=UPI001E524975|nr:hypothetical protein [Roseiconus lacunae]
MLQWLRDWRSRRRRLLFRYFDGQRTIAVDPLELSRMLSSDPEFLPRHLDEAISGDNDAIEICGRACVRTFRVTNLTLGEQIALLVKFDDWIEALKKNTMPFVA